MRKPTRKFWIWLTQFIVAVGSLYEADEFADFFKSVLGVEIATTYWGVRVLWVIAICWFVWRAIDGFFRKKDFAVDQNDY